MRTGMPTPMTRSIYIEKRLSRWPIVTDFEAAIAASRLLMHRLEAANPVGKALMILTPGVRADSSNKRTDVTPRASEDVCTIPPEDGVDEEDEVAKEKPREVEESSSVADSELQRKWKENEHQR